ncbi:ABC transporter substrate-binding protein [Parvicella tangerina]|uniref:Heme-binding protein A n=1 Tax=Parvicella tangerina TaxID=2829795 RepID=A0A916JQC7_9FLAO|nr:ABC transporter substrate-binding protein [Parvicella tangerina]CAG5086998.1 Heme-binding protein A [Parvicella tangerina]
MKLQHLFLVGFALFALSSCETEGDEVDGGEVNKRESDGKTVFYGGTLSVSEDETYSSIFPLEVLDVTSSKVVSQIHDGLVEYDPRDYSIRPAVADDWTVNDAKTEYTFHLRDNVRFHDDECFEGGVGRVLSAEDVKYTFELLCSKECEYSYSSFLKPYLKGAEAFFNGTADHIEGLEIVDDHTVKFTLNEPSSSFIYILAMPNTSIIPKEAFEKYGKEMTVGCGPFMYTKPKDMTKAIDLVYNPKYYGRDENGNALPYLDSIHFAFVPSKLEQLEMFNEHKLSLIQGLPSAKIAQVVSENIENFKNNPPKTILDRQPDLSTEYYAFICTQPPFDDVRVRKAFNYAIDRNSLLNEVLNGQGTPGMYGITPKIPAFNTYDFSRIKGYDYNPELAKQLLAEAGYPNGEGFPEITLEINLGGNVHKLVSTDIERQIKENLGITISIDQVSFKTKMENSKLGKSEIYRSAWVADFPSPESFLSIFYGGEVPTSMSEPSYPNVMRYTNAKFDSLYNLGKVTVDDIERNNYFAEAEKIMMEDAPIMVLWYTENYTMYHSDVRGFYNNGLALADFSRVFFKEMTAEEIEEIEKMNKSNY